MLNVTQLVGFGAGGSRTPPSFVSVSTLAAGTTSTSANLPAGYAAGDILLIFAESRHGSIDIATPSGYTLVIHERASNDTILAVFYKVASGSESSPTVTAAGDHILAVMACYRGVSNVSPINVVDGDTQEADGTINFPSVVTTTANCLVILAINSMDDSTVVSNFTAGNLAATPTERTQQQSTQGDDGQICFADAVMTSAGSIGTPTCTTASTDTLGTRHAFASIALAPA